MLLSKLLTPVATSLRVRKYDTAQRCLHLPFLSKWSLQSQLHRPPAEIMRYHFLGLDCDRTRKLERLNCLTSLPFSNNWIALISRFSVIRSHLPLFRFMGQIVWLTDVSLLQNPAASHADRIICGEFCENRAATAGAPFFLAKFQSTYLRHFCSSNPATSVDLFVQPEAKPQYGERSPGNMAAMDFFDCCPLVNVESPR